MSKASGKLCNAAYVVLNTIKRSLQHNQTMYPSSHMKAILWFGNTYHCKLSNANGRRTTEVPIYTATCCLYHVQSCSNFTTDSKITMFTSRSNFQRRDSLVWERDCTTSSLSSIWSASDGESLTLCPGWLLWNGQTAMQGRSGDGSSVSSYCLCVLWAGGAQQPLVFLTWHSPVWEG